MQAGTLALARHDFSSALVLAQRAQRQSGGAGAVAPYPVLVDALVELGRYDEAERALQAMVDLKPNLAAYARVSYLRELHGDLDGAAAAMRDAIAAGGPAPEHVASLQTLLAGLELARGRRAGGPARVPTLRWPPCPATFPRSRRHARLRASRGDLGGAVAALAAGRRAAAAARVRRPPSARPSWPRAAARAPAATWRWCGVQRRLLAAAGVNTDVELAVVRGRPRRSAPRRRAGAARLGGGAQRALRGCARLGAHPVGPPARGPGWARRALRLGSLDPLLRFHAGMTARAAGRPREGARAPAHGARARAGGATPWQAGRRGRRSDEAARRRRRGGGGAPRPAGRRVRAPARQLLVQPPHARRGLERPGGRALRARPGGDPDVPGARSAARRGAAAQTRGGGPAAGGARRRPSRGAGDGATAAPDPPARTGRAAPRPGSSSTCAPPPAAPAA